MNYNSWNDAIGKFFFNPENADKLVYLQIDSDTLKEIAKSLNIPPEQAEPLFVQLIRSLLASNDEPLRNIRRQTNQWWTLRDQKPNDYPPCIGLLAFSVLVASKMYTDKDLGFSSGNYYRHLEDLLNGKWKTFRTEFQGLDNFWEKLNQWLTEKNYGIPTASNWKGREHVGYPISQVLLRQVDREKLPSFFQSCGWQPTDPTIQEVEIREQLQLWAKKSTCKLTKTCQNILKNNDQEAINQISKMVLAEYQKWDGSDIDGEGNPSVQMRLQLEVTSQKFRTQLYIPAPTKFPEGFYTLANGKKYDLKRDPEVPNWFEPLDNDTDLLKPFLQGNPVRIYQGKYQLQLPPQKIIPFQEDEDIGGWVSCNQPKFNMLHIILCHREYKEQVESFLKNFAQSGFQSKTSSQPIFKDWVCFTGVKLIQTPPEELTGEIAILTPSRRIRIKFEGGLAIKRGVWVRGNEPNLTLDLDHETPEPIFVDGLEIALDSSKTLDLSKLNLEKGKHEIRIGSQTRTFETVDLDNAQDVNSEKLGHPLIRKKHQVQLQSVQLQQLAYPFAELEEDKLIICGAKLVGSKGDTSFPIEHEVVLPYGKHSHIRYIVLGKYPGEAKEYHKGHVPLWQAEKEGLVYGHKELVPFEPQWLIMSTTNESLRAIGKPSLPEHSDAQGDNLGLWCQWARQKGLARKLPKDVREIWVRYNEVAKRSK